MKRVAVGAQSTHHANHAYINYIIQEGDFQFEQIQLFIHLDKRIGGTVCFLRDRRAKITIQPKTVFFCDYLSGIYLHIYNLVS